MEGTAAESVCWEKGPPRCGPASQDSRRKDTRVQVMAPGEERRSDTKQQLRGRTLVTRLCDSSPGLRSKLAGSSRGTDPEAIEAGSAKVPLCERRQSNRLMGYMIAGKEEGR